MKEPIHSVTAKDFEITASRGSGKGGQKRNKTETKVRVFHKDSGAVGISDDTRSKHQNQKIAFQRCIETKEFKNWHKIEIARVLGIQQQIEDSVEAMMKRDNDFKIEGKENGRWSSIT